MGETKRHGPHQGAQRSITTVGWAFASTSNVDSSASTTHASGLPHLAQNGEPRSLAPIRFGVPQLAHTRVWTGFGPPEGGPEAVSGAVINGSPHRRSLPSAGR